MPRKPSRLASSGVRLAIEGQKTPGTPGDDERLGWLLVRMWSLASGRTVRMDVPMDQLTEDELILFWADDFTISCGRHAAGGTGRGELESAVARPSQLSA